jgi:phosphotransferase system enzyme I (PtsI)
LRKMVETPAAVLLADELAKEVDFFSIGTNDLTQYTLAVDRGNEKISNIYNPFHPAVIRSIKRVIESAHKANIWVGMCGELAGDEKAALLLLGMGLDEFSMSAISLPVIKNLIRSLSYQEMVSVANKVLNMSTISKIEDYLGKILYQLQV